MKRFITINIIILVLLIVFLPPFSRIQDMKTQLNNYQTQIRNLNKQNSDLKKELNLLKNDPVYLEKVAREKLGVTKEGEVIYRIKTVNPPPKTK